MSVVHGRREEAGERVDAVEGIRGVCSVLFEEPSISVSPSTSKLDIRVYELDLSSYVLAEKIEIDRKRVSKALDYVRVGGEAYGYPRWRYDAHADVSIGEAVDAVLEIEGGLLGARYEDLTPMPGEDTFRYSRQLFFASTENPVARLAVFENRGGGVDIAAEVSSQSSDTRYSVLVSVSRGRIGYGCTCPIGDRGLMCKHILAVISAVPHIVISRLAGNPDAEEEVRGRVSRVIGRFSNRVGGLAAVSYYLGKLVRVKSEAFHIESPGEAVTRLLQGDRSIFDYIEEEKKVVTPVIEPRESEEIVWGERAEELRRRVERLIGELGSRFGYRSAGDYPELLAYALSLSGDYSKPPVVIHVIGDPGTFKTTGARILSSVIRIPVMRVSMGGDPSSLYTAFCDTFSSIFGIDVKGFAGGLIRSLSLHANGLEAEIDLVALSAIAREKGLGIEAIEDLARRLMNMGAGVSVAERRASTGVIDTSSLVSLDAVRYRYEVNRATGMMITRSGPLDNYVVLIDEGSRAGRAVEALLTLTSIPATSSLFETPRIFIITDNISPYESAMRSDELAAFHDRSVKAVARSARSELESERSMARPLGISFSASELDYLSRFISRIPVPQGVLLLVKAIALGLEYKFAPREGHVEVIPRSSRSDVELSILPGDIEVYSGGRFMHHALSLARFSAFLGRRSRVSIEDLSRFLEILILSHARGDSFEEVKRASIEAAKTIREALAKGEELIEWSAGLMASLASGGDFNIYLEDAKRDPMRAALLFASLEILVSSGRIDPGRLPRSARLCMASLALARGDMEMLKIFSKEVEEIRGGYL